MQNLRVTETNVDYVVIAWDVPESDGGSPITGYVVEKRDIKRSAFVKVCAFIIVKIFKLYFMFINLTLACGVIPSKVRF